MKNKCNLIFGYGSIRTDLGNYGRVPSYLEPIGFGTIDHALYRIRNHGFATWAGVRQDEIGKTFGQVFKIQKGLRKQALWLLDRREFAESIARLYFTKPAYIRRLVDVKLESGKTVKSWVYFAAPPVSQFIHRIESGDWKDALDKKGWL